MLIHHPNKMESNDAIFEALMKCDLIHLAMQDGDHPYVLPLNFGAEKTDEGIVIYLHLTENGKKKELLEMNPVAGFEANWYQEAEAKTFHCHLIYQSVTGFGKVEFLTGEEDCVHALNALLGHYGRKQIRTYSRPMFEDLTMARLLVTEWTGKEIREY